MRTNGGSVFFNSLMKMTSSEADIICITQITLKLINNALLANDGWFPLLTFKLLANFWTVLNTDCIGLPMLLLRSLSCLRTKSADLWSLKGSTTPTMFPCDMALFFLSLIILQNDWIQKRGNCGINQSIRVPHLKEHSLKTIALSRNRFPRRWKAVGPL